MPADDPKRTGTTLSERIQPSHLGTMLRLYRTIQQQSVRELGKVLGISAATLSRIERGQTFDTATLLKLWTWLLQKEKSK